MWLTERAMRGGLALLLFHHEPDQGSNGIDTEFLVNVPAPILDRAHTKAGAVS
jgi:hypothetical protein